MTGLEVFMKQKMVKFDKTVSNKPESNKQVETQQDSSRVTHTDMANNKKAAPLEGVKSYKIIIIWTLKHDIISNKY